MVSGPRTRLSVNSKKYKAFQSNKKTDDSLQALLSKKEVSEQMIRYGDHGAQEYHSGTNCLLEK